MIALPSPVATILGALAGEVRRSGGRAWLVGGAVRDALLGRAPLDLDVAVEAPTGTVTAVAAALAANGWVPVAVHGRFGTATVRSPEGLRLDLASTREERYPEPGALPVVTAGVPIERDLGRRDFAIHAMAIPVGASGPEEPLLDPFSGERDLAARRIRLLHERSLADDPTRVFRAARYAARFGFELDPGFLPALRVAEESGSFVRISGDRLRRAFREVLSEENRGVAFGILARLGVPSLVVGGWSVSEEAAEARPGTASLEEAWGRILASAPGDLRSRIAERLRFSRALRRATGCPA